MKNSCAFTLIELLVVVLIIGILAAVAVPQYHVAVGKAQFVELLTLGDAVCKAEEVYYLENGTYTNNLDELDLSIPLNPKSYTIALNVTDPYVIVRSASINPYYIHYFNQHAHSGFRGRRECRATNTLGRKICSSLTQNTERMDSGGNFWARKL